MNDLPRSILFKTSLVSAIALAASGAIAQTVSSPALVRTGPGLKWPVIAEIPAGANVRVMNCYGGWERGWCQVRYRKVKGFVEGLTLAPSGADNVIVAPIVTTDLANLRSGPGTKWPVVGVLTPGTEVNVSQCVSGWLSGWCRVSFQGSEAWIHGSLLKSKGAIFD